MSQLLIEKDTPISIGVKEKYRSNKFRVLKRILEKLLILKRDKSLSHTLYLDILFPKSYFSVTARANSYYGGGVLEIGDDNLIMGVMNFEAPSGKISIGNSCFIGSNTQINCMNTIEINDNVLIAGSCMIQDHNSHSVDYLQRRKDINFAISRFLGYPNKNKDFSKIKNDRIVIGKDSWIGYGCYILKGVIIGERVIVAAGSVVVKDIPDDAMVAGNPAKIIRIQNVI